MLVLSQALDEAIVIGEDVVVTILDVKDGQVRLGISAPSKVKVDRAEVRERIVAERTTPKRRAS